MRRVSLALALLGAVTAAGCSGGAKSSSSGEGKGTVGQTFTVTIQNGQNGNTSLAIVGGKVTSTPPGIDCGVGTTQVCTFDFDVATPVVLTATPAAANDPAYNLPYQFTGWAGDCLGLDICTLSGNADKYVLATFGGKMTGHANFTAPEAHVSAYLVQSRQGALKCSECHGASLQGSGIAVACSSCHASGGHDWPVTAALVTTNVPVTNVGKHFEATGHASGTCARCHAGDGFRDFIGADGSASAVLTVGYGSTAVAATDITVACTATVTTNCLNPGISCNTCHNSVTVLGGGALNQHKFPSGNVLTMDGNTAICSQCHDGGRPGYEVSQLAIAIKAVTDDAQLPTADNKVVRAHYTPAASTLFGSEAANWYQYTGKVYTARNQHGGKASCTSCHDAHTGALPADSDIAAKCGVCHFNDAGAPVANFLELQGTRQFGFEGDIDGDGVVESLKAEIDGLGAKLYEAIQAYAQNVAGAGICAIDNRYYIQVNTTDACGIGANAVAYNRFTPRLLRAGYNYLVYQNDTGAWGHNPRYAIEVIFDTITNLNAGLTAAVQTPVAFGGFRTFEGHFGAVTAAAPAGGMAFRDWDPGPVPAACSQCHAGETGFANYLVDQLTVVTNTPVTGMQCTTCHQPQPTDANFKTMRAVATINFPPAKVAAKQVTLDAAATFPKAADRVCATCHSGRENMITIDGKIAAQVAPIGPLSWNISFTNPHYLGAAGVMLGSDTHMLYEYAGKTYASKPVFWGSPYGSPHGQSCTGCHQPQASKHSFEVDMTYCVGCHTGAYALEPVKAEVAALSDRLYTTIVAYSANVANFDTGIAVPVCYNGGAYPYWFKDNGTGTGTPASVAGDGICQPGESVSANGAKFNPAASKAAFNYKWSQAEPGAYAHNEPYIFQVLFDSITDLGGDTTGFVRP